MKILVGDIGGTKTNLAIFSSEKGPRAPLLEKTYSSSQYSSFEDMVHDFSSIEKEKVESACLGVAGPILHDRAQVTNLSWAVDAHALQSKFHLKHVTLLNDLEALAYSIPVLIKEDLHTLNTGMPASNDCIAIIAPGTGLGEAFITFDGGTCQAHPSEGGHASFAPENELQIGLLSYLKDLGHHHVSFERVCSGMLGIPNLFEYLKITGMEEPVWLAKQLAGAEDLTPIIVNAALDPNRSCPLAEKTLELFVAILGAETGNLALKVLSTGGVYLGGGIPPRILDALAKPAFLESMRNKGRFRQLITGMPVHVIMNSNAALFGAAYYGFKHFMD